MEQLADKVLADASITSAYLYKSNSTTADTTSFRWETVAVKGSELTVDFTGTSPQVDWGGNVVYNFTYAYVHMAVKSIFDPEIPNNDGIAAPMVLLTGIVIMAGNVVSWKIQHRNKDFYILLLVLVGGVFAWTQTFRALEFEPRAVQVQFRYAFVTTAQGLEVVDITDIDRANELGPLLLQWLRQLDAGTRYDLRAQMLDQPATDAAQP